MVDMLIEAMIVAGLAALSIIWIAIILGSMQIVGRRVMYIMTPAQVQDAQDITSDKSKK